MSTNDIEKEARVCTFHSMRGGTGKSTAIANVAIKLAMADKKVLIVDWNIESPGMESIFESLIRRGKIFDEGIVSLIVNRKKDWKKAITRINAYKELEFDFLSVGRDAEGYFELIGKLLEDLTDEYFSGEILKLVGFFDQEWKKGYDYILIDCPKGKDVVAELCGRIIPSAILFFLRTGRMIKETMAFEKDWLTNLESFYPDYANCLMVPIVTMYPTEERYQEKINERFKEVAKQGSLLQKKAPKEIFNVPALKSLGTPLVNDLLIDDVINPDKDKRIIIFDSIAELILNDFHLPV